MADQYTDTEAFRGARFRGVDLNGAVFRECYLNRVVIVGSVFDELRISPFAGDLGTVIVDDVDVTAFVTDELDRRYPERVRLRSLNSIADYRATWTLLEALWDETGEAVAQLPEDMLHERVGDEWSYVETMRHLVFAIDVWVGRMLRGEPTPFHPFGLPPTDHPRDEAADLGLELDARPAYAEVLEVHADRRARYSAELARVTDADLAEIRTAVPTPAWGVESHSVGDCLRVILNEHSEHRRYALRDLAALAARK